MTDRTITQLTTTTSAAAADEIPLWVAASSVTRKITKANFMGGVLTGGGTVATGGYTLTVPATGTAALTVAETWTPVLNFGGATTGITYGTQTARSILVGRMVWIAITIVLTSKGSATGAATITGLPIEYAGVSGAFTCYFASLGTAILNMVAINTAASTLSLYHTASAVTSMAATTDAIFGNSTTLVVSGCYRTSA